MQWYVVYTKPKCEDSTARLFNNAGIETLNPKINVIKMVRGKYTHAVEELFPSYIFACFDKDKHCRMIKYTRGVKYIVGRENPKIVPIEIIQTIKEKMQGGTIMPESEDFKKGDRVLIKEGPFKDFYGIFQRDMPGKARAMVLLDILSGSLQIEARSILRHKNFQPAGLIA